MSTRINGAGSSDSRFVYGDTTFDAIYVGRSRTNTGHMNADVAGAFIVDENLNSYAIYEIISAMYDLPHQTLKFC